MRYFFFACWLALAAPGWSQTGQLAGRVLADSAGAPLATVRVLNTAFGAATDAAGYFRLDSLPAGAYLVEIRLLGYRTQQRPVTIRPGQTTALNVTLPPDPLGLDEVVVSAARYELDRSVAPVVVGVLDPRVFSATQSVLLAEGLPYQPGVRVEANCQNCGFTQVRLNGLEGGYSQILINSRPVFSALTSVYGLEQIPTNIVERVEVVRGGGSALYGSNAIAGTINIITKEPINNTWQLGTNYGRIGGAAHDLTLTFNGSVVADDLRSGVTFYGMRRDREAFDANGDGFTELTTLENNTFGAKAFFKPGERSKLTLDFSAIREARRGGDRLGLAPHLTDIAEALDHNTLLGGVTYEWYSPDRATRLTAYASAQRTGRDSYYGGLGGGRTAADSALALNAYGNTTDLSFVSGAQVTHHLSEVHTLTGGAEYQRNAVDDRIPGYNRTVDQSVDNWGAYGQYTWQPAPALTALLGARYDRTAVAGRYVLGALTRDNDRTVDAFSPRLSVRYRLAPAWQVRGSYARGFRAPQAFNEDLHISSVGGEPQFVLLSESLEKELSDALTGSLSYTRPGGGVPVSVLVEGFYTALRQPFVLVSTGATLPNGSVLEEVRNGTGAYVAGTNAEVNVAPNDFWRLQAGGTWQHTRYDDPQVLFEPDEPGDGSVVTTDRFVRTPDVYGFLTVGWQPLLPWGVDLTGTYTGPMVVPRVADASGRLELRESNPFLEMNLKVSYRFALSDGLHLSVSGGVQNLLDSYQDDFDRGPTRDSDYVYGPLRPRTLFFGITLGNQR